MPDLSIERGHGGCVAGVDEAGRGPWAGPVVAAAVILPAGLPADLAGQLDDSKKLRAQKRETLLSALLQCADIGMGAASVAEIEKFNILAASHIAMCRAVSALRTRPDIALIDGNLLPPGLSCPARAIVGGDGLSLSIAAASIVAKVTRDRIMTALAARYPAYRWERNAGYGTRQHREGLAAAGVTPHHRRGFKPVTQILSQPQEKTPHIAITP